MSYKVFLSFTDADRQLATQLDYFLNNEFDGSIDTCFSGSDVRAGHQWKDWIKKNIHECNAIVVLLTKNSLSKPWIYIEWSAFWCADKTIYILKTDEIKQTDLINPMQDAQYASITDVESFKGFIHHLSDEAGRKKHPIKNAPAFVEEAKEVIAAQKEEAFKKLVEEIEKDPEALPDNDLEKKQIALRFIKSGNLQTLKIVFEKIGNVNVQTDVLISFIEAGFIKEVGKLIADPGTTDVTWKTVNQLIGTKIQQRESVDWLIDFLALYNNVGLRNVALHMIEKGLDSDPMFKRVIAAFGNMSVLEKVANRFIIDGDITNANLFAICNRFVKENGSCARNCGIKLIEGGHTDSKIFETIFKGLIENNLCAPAKRLLDLLKNEAEEFYLKYKLRYDERCGK